MRQVFEFGSFRLDPDNQTLSRGGERIHLTAKAYSALVLLVERAGLLVSKEEILSSVWPEGFVEPANLTQTVYLLRKALDDGDSQVIETVPARGYRFVPDVKISLLSNGRTGFAKAANKWKLSLIAFASLTVVALAVAGFINLGALTRTVVIPPVNAEAQRDYILGRHYWNERTVPNINLAMQYFKAAVALDPHFAKAYSGIADCYSTLGYYTGYSAEARNARIARKMALKAIALDPLGAEGHASLAFADEFMQPTGAYADEIDREFHRSIELDPKYATAREWYSWFLFLHNRYNQALTQIVAARDLDPLSPVINFALGNQLYYTRHFAESAKQWQLAITLDPASEAAYFGAGLADEQSGHTSRAEHEFKQALHLAPHDPDAIASLAHVYALEHQPDATRQLLSRISTIKPAPAYDIALLNEVLGDHHTALRWLVTAKSQGDPNLIVFDVDPRMCTLRNLIPKPVLKQLVSWN